jgi:hypothetical protein
VIEGPLEIVLAVERRAHRAREAHAHIRELGALVPLAERAVTPLLTRATRHMDGLRSRDMRFSSLLEPYGAMSGYLVDRLATERDPEWRRAVSRSARRGLRRRGARGGGGQGRARRRQVHRHAQASRPREAADPRPTVSALDR